MCFEYLAERFTKVVSNASEDPWHFIMDMLLLMSPFFAVSALLAYHLMCAVIKEQEIVTRNRPDQAEPATPPNDTPQNRSAYQTRSFRR